MRSCIFYVFADDVYCNKFICGIDYTFECRHEKNRIYLKTLYLIRKNFDKFLTSISVVNNMHHNESMTRVFIPGLN